MGREGVCWDRSQSNRLGPKLTKEHITIPAFNDMQGNLATRVMSHTVAAGMTTLKALGKLPKIQKHQASLYNFSTHYSYLFRSRSTSSISKSGSSKEQ